MGRPRILDGSGGRRERDRKGGFSTRGRDKRAGGVPLTATGRSTLEDALEWIADDRALTAESRSAHTSAGNRESRRSRRGCWNGLEGMRPSGSGAGGCARRRSRARAVPRGAWSLGASSSAEADGRRASRSGAHARRPHPQGSTIGGLSARTSRGEKARDNPLGSAGLAALSCALFLCLLLFGSVVDAGGGEAERGGRQQSRTPRRRSRRGKKADRQGQGAAAGQPAGRHSKPRLLTPAREATSPAGARRACDPRVPDEPSAGSSSCCSLWMHG